MASGKSSEEAGPSSSAAAEEQVKQKEMTQNNPSTEFADADSHDDELAVDDDDKEVFAGFVPGPLLSLKEQIEKDKDDESLRRWKEKLLGCVESDLNGQMEPEVNFHSIGIVSDNLKEVTTPLPLDEKQNGRLLFTLKEGSRYRLKITFSVLHNIVSGLTYTNTVWKGGLQVDQSKGMLGTFAPQQEPYMHLLDEETTPSGVLARGVYSAKLKFEDDDKRCHMELQYSFEIRKG